MNTLSHASRLALRELCEAMGARVQGYAGGLQLTMKPSEDRRGWSMDALQLHGVLQALGLVERQPRWSFPCTVPNDPYANYRGYLFSVCYELTRDPFPLASTVSR